MTRALSVFLTAILAVLTACGGGSGSGFQFNGNGGSNGGSNSGGGTGNPIQHVIIVVFENQDYANVVGSSSMPYWNGLANSASLAATFYADVHPSLGNYFIMTAGQDPTLGSSDPDNWSGTISGDTVASVLSAAGKTWKVYAQSLPSTGYLGGDQYPYVKHHNPFAYFDTVQKSQSLAAKIVSLSELSSDVSSGTLPNYSFVVPDDQHNGHDCPGGGSGCPLSDRLAAIDNFLKTNFDPLFTNSALMANTVVIVTFDESASDLTNGGGHVPVILAGGPIKTQYQSTTMYQHQSLLRFSLQSLGQNIYPGLANVATPMTEFLK
ncbi:MAG: alkaline phosphatase family protein [Terriglobales bacterium]